MANIKIKRTNDYINGMRKYRLFIDGQKVGTIGNDETKDFDVTPGQHIIIAKIDWCSSPEFSFDTKDNDSKILIVGGFKSWKWIMPLFTIFIILALLLDNAANYIRSSLVLIPLVFLLYYLTIGSKNYLTINEIRKRKPDDPE